MVRSLRISMLEERKILLVHIRKQGLLARSVRVE